MLLIWWLYILSIKSGSVYLVGAIPNHRASKCAGMMGTKLGRCWLTWKLHAQWWHPQEKTLPDFNDSIYTHKLTEFKYFIYINAILCTVFLTSIIYW